jgi:predicted DNA-binding protein
MGTAPKRSFATRLPSDEARLLEKEIAQSEKNSSQYLREIIEEYLDEKEGEEQPSIGSVEKMLQDLE